MVKDRFQKQIGKIRCPGGSRGYLEGDGELGVDGDGRTVPESEK
jgi:hypothetical protein